MEFINQIRVLAGPLADNVPVALLVMARVIPAVILAPFLGGQKIPQRIRVVVGITLTLFIAPMVEPIAPPATLVLIALVFKELAIGLLIGFVASLLFHAILSAGRLIDLMRGSNQASMMVPQIAAESSPVGQFQFQLSVAYFLVIGGHLLYLRALCESFIILKPAAVVSGGSFLGLTEWVIRMGADVLLIAFQLAAPAAIAIVLTDVTLGIINRFAPQIHVFFLGMPVKAIAGLAILLISLTLTVKLLEDRLAVVFAQAARITWTLGTGA